MSDLRHSMQRKLRLLATYLISLTPEKLCLGPLPVCLDNEKGQQELRSRGPSAMFPLSPYLKDAFEKFEQDFLASNLPEGKYVKPPDSKRKWFKVGQPCFEDKLQELNSDFAKICISPKPSKAPMGKVPIQVLEKLEHQARQNLSNINFPATFAKTVSTFNNTMEKCQDSLKPTFKKVKSQIQKGANPEKAARHGYENACDYFEILNKRIFIQQKALARLSKSLAIFSRGSCIRWATLAN